MILYIIEESFSNIYAQMGQGVVNAILVPDQVRGTLSQAWNNNLYSTY